MDHDALFLVFEISATRYALRFGAVLRVLPMVEVTPLPQAADAAVGVINVAGSIVPVLALRRRLGLPERDARLSDVLILARTRRRTVALAADGVVGLVQRERVEVTPGAAIYPRLRHLDGVVKLDDGMALIHDLDRFLSIEEDERLQRAIDAREPTP
jgi:purine-binding chemotaxis protein CheW